jgi:glyoxylase-like metal-dependent hydrolase (beta-lactamase superfamily II)/rhodanese-related sulfurtransferase
MNIIPFVHEGLGNSSYLVQVGQDEAVLVDPNRSVEQYLRAAEERGWRISALVETHLHADFVSGARNLAHEAGAEIYTPAQSDVDFPHRPVKPGERFGFGSVEIETIASPGHTPEHTSYVLRVEGEAPVLFSGGSLIVGGAARTDLISPDMTEQQTHWMFNTLQTAFSSLPDETLLYPTHGSGSFCSAVPGTARTSTLREEREQNAALAMKDEDKFVTWFPTTFPAIPAYYSRMRPINKQGPTLRNEIATPAALGPEQFEAAMQNAVVVDVRSTTAYAKAHIPGSLSNEFRDAYLVWLGWLAEENKPLLFVRDDESIDQIVEESSLVGYEKFAGWLDGGIEGWEQAGKPIASTPLIDADAAKKALLEGAAVLDVREPNEFASGHIADAISIPLGQLTARTNELPKDRPIVAYCGHGERSASGVSILERAGFEQLLNMDGGFGAWERAGFAKEEVSPAV